MVIDSSALLAILENEPERPAMIAAIEAHPTRLISAATVLETTLVVQARAGDVGVDDLDLLLTRLGATAVDFPAHDLPLARRAARLFGRGRHAARLNYGDCFTYALAASSGEPCLFKGDDFPHTDLRAVEY